ncbi:hypothetical protein [uncultured Thiothrix sp.]|uniref:Alvin_2107 family globule sulfur oxidation protein n=1 Tax=uncultured Thiothrix sp. TaxID=223185 RepID=UPI00260DEB08|nr:hypothetical protein [uncultured Thiothrix sp.]
MNQQYYAAVVAMEKAGTNSEFVQGWQNGYLYNPLREEQRLNAAYEAGYDAGKSHDLEAYKDWVQD